MIILLSILSVVVSLFITHKLAVKDGFLNPISAFFSLIPFFGLALMVFILLYEYLNDYYENR